jgi:hypothetical protein
MLTKYYEQTGSAYLNNFSGNNFSGNNPGEVGFQDSSHGSFGAHNSGGFYRDGAHNQSKTGSKGPAKAAFGSSFANSSELLPGIGASPGRAAGLIAAALHADRMVLAKWIL